MDRTVENLTKAFIGESQARNRYTIYSKEAKKEGYEQISAIFTETAEQEREHAKWLYRLIESMREKNPDMGEAIVVEAEAPLTLKDTIAHLKASIAGEHHETAEMYPEFARIAKEEGYPEVAKRLKSIGRAERHHEERYRKLLKEVEGGTVFKKEEKVAWVCRKCGYVHEGPAPPKKCPSCDHEAKYFQRLCEEY